MQRVLIIGSGLTGLTLAWQLKKIGVSFRILEARDRLGGRIHTVSGESRGTPLEMGATWFGDKHGYLNGLLEELGVRRFHQRKTGRAWFESMSFVPPQQFDIPDDGEPYYRIWGGTTALIEALVEVVGREHIQLQTPVSTISAEETSLRVEDRAGNRYQAEYVISTLPPRLLAQKIEIFPALPDELRQVMSTTHTWMSESIKFAVEYARPFWLEHGFSGTAYSQVGPITEMYDHSDAQGRHFALKGFLNPSTGQLTAEKRRQKVKEQLFRFFGDEATRYLAYRETIWAAEPFTHSAYDQFVLPHQHNGHPAYGRPQLDGRLWIGGTETSPHFGGYMEGAVYSAMMMAEGLRKLEEVR